MSPEMMLAAKRLAKSVLLHLVSVVADDPSAAALILSCLDLGGQVAMVCAQRRLAPLELPEIKVWWFDENNMPTDISKIPEFQCFAIQRTGVLTDQQIQEWKDERDKAIFGTITNRSQQVLTALGSLKRYDKVVPHVVPQVMHHFENRAFFIWK